MEEVEKGIKIPMKAHTAVAPVSPSRVHFAQSEQSHTHMHTKFSRSLKYFVFTHLSVIFWPQRERDGSEGGG